MESLDHTVEIEQVFCFKCPKCEYVSLFKEAVEEHLKKEHQFGNVNVSEETTSSDFLLNDCDLEPNQTSDDEPVHTGDVSTSSTATPKGFTCSVGGCGVRLEKECDAQYHLKCHDESSFKCPECGEIKSSWKAMVMHLWKSHLINLELLSCHLCGYRTGKKELLKFHVNTHSDQRTCLCDECGKGFKNMKQLRNHKVSCYYYWLNVLNNLINNVLCTFVSWQELHSVNKGSSEQQLKNKCPDCGQILSSSRLLRAHRNAVHLKMRSHLCNYCGYNTTSQSNLRIHLRRHTEEKPFSCDSCDYRTSDHNSLRRHKMKHTGEKQYKCPHCSYASIQSSTYKVKKNYFSK